jgi:hypothetical protein
MDSRSLERDETKRDPFASAQSRWWLAVLLTLLVCGCSDEYSAAAPGGAGGAGGGNGSGGAGGASTPEGIPCDVNELLAKHCRGCHAEPPRFGAPMPLVSLEHIHAPAVSDPGRAVAEVIRERLVDETSPMPPTGEMTDDERAVLDGWLAAGAPAYAGPDCDDPPPVEPPIGPDALDCTPSHTFVAHADGSADAYHVPAQGADNLYQCFTFKSPFDGVRQGTAWAPIIDDERVLHHWILYRTATVQPDGGVMPCNMPQDATFVAGWAPGGLNFVLPDDVGLELGGPDDYFILQMHYHNTAQHADALDASGVALCTTETPREHDAGVFTLGTVLINVPPYANGYQATGECRSWMTSFLSEPVHIIASFPHMHELGRSFRTDIFRGADNGPRENLVDIDTWVFDNQRYYPHEPAVTFYPGDAIRTTCTYDNPTSQSVGFGERTEDEMCFNFVLLYPISLFTGNRSCGLL